MQHVLFIYYYSRCAYIVVPTFDANKILSLCPSHRFTGEFCIYCVLDFPVLGQLLPALASL